MKALKQINMKKLRKTAANWAKLHPIIGKVSVFEVEPELDADEGMPSICLCIQTPKEHAHVIKTRERTGSQAKPGETIKYVGLGDEVAEFLSESFFKFNLEEVSKNPSLLWMTKIYSDFEEIEEHSPLQVYPATEPPQNMRSRQLSLYQQRPPKTIFARAATSGTSASMVKSAGSSTLLG